MKFGINKTKNSLGELQTTLHWVLTVISPPAAVGDFSEDLQIRVQTTGLPEVTEDTTKVELQGHIINFPGKTTKNGELTAGFVEGTDAKVIAYFTKCAKARWSGDGKDTEGKQTLTKDLKADVKLELMSPDDVVTQTYTLIGTMFKMQKGATLGQVADAMMPQITMEYDDFHTSAGGVEW